MTDEKGLADRSAAAVLVRTSEFQRLDIYREVRSITDVTPLAAEMNKSLARSQFEVPAKEESRRWYASVIAMVLLGAVAFAKLDGAALAGVLVALAAAMGGAKIVEELKKRTPPT